MGSGEGADRREGGVLTGGQNLLATQWKPCAHSQQQESAVSERGQFTLDQLEEHPLQIALGRFLLVLVYAMGEGETHTV